MELTIRADVSTHMRELKQWLAQTRDEPAEDMNGFFAARVDTYEAHMSVWDKAYGRVAELTPGDCGPLLDLGCGTGLELDRLLRGRGDSAAGGKRAPPGSREHPGGCVHPLRHAADAGARACPAAGRGLFVLRGRGQHRGSHVPARPQIRLVTEKPYKRVRKL